LGKKGKKKGQNGKGEIYRTPHVTFKQAVIGLFSLGDLQTQAKYILCCFQVGVDRQCLRVSLQRPVCQSVTSIVPLIKESHI